MPFDLTIKFDKRKSIKKSISYRRAWENAAGEKSAATSQIMQFAMTLNLPRGLFEFVELENCQKSFSYVTDFLVDMSLTELVIKQFREIIIPGKVIKN